MGLLIFKNLVSSRKIGRTANAKKKNLSIMSADTKIEDFPKTNELKLENIKCISGIC